MESRALTSAGAGPSGRQLTHQNEFVQYCKNSQNKGYRRISKPCRVQAAATTVTPIAIAQPNLEVLGG